MSTWKEYLRKTPLKSVWGLILSVPGVRQLKNYCGDKLRDRLLFHTLPGAYNAHREEPVVENKILILEPRVADVSDNFQVILEELSKYKFDVHVHLLQEKTVSHREYIRRSKLFLADAATAKYIFLDDASDIVGCVSIRPETVVTQLWHACGAFKKFGMSTADLLFGYNAEQQKRHPAYGNLSHVTVSSPEIVWAYAEAMNLKGHEDVIKPIGTSRTDIFFRPETIVDAYRHLYEKFPAAKEKKIILFAPTFRGTVAYARTVDCFDLEMFYKAFGEEYVVITKHHPYVHELPKIPEHLKNTFAYDATKTMTIEDLLCVSDICISDYSSLIFEYSLFERPMLFYAYDLEEYFDWRGFYYPYDELTPGPVCNTNEEMIDYIQHIDERFDKQQVIDFKNKFMSACDGHATERILDLVFGQEILAAHKKA